MKEKIIKISNRRQRARVLTQLRTQGIRVKHDFGKFLIVETPQKKGVEKSLLKQRIRLESPTERAFKVRGVSPDEKLLVDAFLLRKSAKFRRRKEKQVSGETPEEKELFSGGCVTNE